MIIVTATVRSYFLLFFVLFFRFFKVLIIMFGIKRPFSLNVTSSLNLKRTYNFFFFIKSLFYQNSCNHFFLASGIFCSHHSRLHQETEFLKISKHTLVLSSFFNLEGKKYHRDDRREKAKKCSFS